MGCVWYMIIMMIYNLFTLTSNHISFHIRILFLPLFWTANSVQFLCSQCHMPASWRLDTRLYNLDYCSVLLYVKVEVTLRLTVSQSVSLGVEPHLGLMTRYLLLFDSYSLVFVGRSLWREDGSVYCICCWVFPTQSFSGPSPWYSRPYFTVSDLRLPISSPLTTRRVTVEVFDPASPTLCCRTLLYNHFAQTMQKTQPPLLRKCVYCSAA
jgi:hypothetical protein